MINDKHSTEVSEQKVLFENEIFLVLYIEKIRIAQARKKS